jgi:hypothetical protein
MCSGFTTLKFAKSFLKELQIFEEFNIHFLGGGVKEPGTSVIVDFMGVIKVFFLL